MKKFPVTCEFDSNQVIGSIELDETKLPKHGRYVFSLGGRVKQIVVGAEETVDQALLRSLREMDNFELLEVSLIPDERYLQLIERDRPRSFRDERSLADVPPTIVACAVLSRGLILSLPRPSRHHDIIHRMHALGIPNTHDCQGGRVRPGEICARDSCPCVPVLFAVESGWCSDGS